MQFIASQIIIYHYNILENILWAKNCRNEDFLMCKINSVSTRNLAGSKNFEVKISHPYKHWKTCMLIRLEWREEKQDVVGLGFPLTAWNPRLYALP